MPTILPKPQVKAAAMPMMKGARPVTTSRTVEGLSSKFIVARRSRERAMSMPMIQMQAVVMMTEAW